MPRRFGAALPLARLAWVGPMHPGYGPSPSINHPCVNKLTTPHASCQQQLTIHPQFPLFKKRENLSSKSSFSRCEPTSHTPMVRRAHSDLQTVSHASAEPPPVRIRMSWNPSRRNDGEMVFINQPIKCQDGKLTDRTMLK